MFEKENEINLPKVAENWCRAVTDRIKFIPDRAAVYRELMGHIEDMADEMEKDDAISKDEAYSKAVERMGDADEIGSELDKQHAMWLGCVWLISKAACAAAAFTLAVSTVFFAANIGSVWSVRNDVGYYEAFECKDLEKLYALSQSGEKPDVESGVYYYTVDPDGGSKMYSTVISKPKNKLVSLRDNGIANIVTNSDAEVYRMRGLSVTEPKVDCKIGDFKLSFDRVKLGELPLWFGLDGISTGDAVSYICQMDVSLTTGSIWSRPDFWHYVKLYDDKGAMLDGEYEIKKTGKFSYAAKIEIFYGYSMDTPPEYVRLRLDKVGSDVDVIIPLTAGEGASK